MARRGKLLAALDVHKARNVDMKRQRTMQTLARKRVAVKEATQVERNHDNNGNNLCANVILQCFLSPSQRHSLLYSSMLSDFTNDWTFLGIGEEWSAHNL